MKIGAQMYTVRDQCQTPEDMRVSLLKTAEIGYRCVQLSGGCEMEPQQLREYADAAGIEIVATHIPFSRIADETEAVIEEHRVFGAKYIGLGMMPKEARHSGELSALEAFFDALDAPIEKINAAGMRFCYHNHSLEFRKLDGKLIFDRMIERFTPSQLGIILDTYWVQNGGGDVCTWIEKLTGRLECVHLKDMEVSPESWKDTVFAPVGGGNLDFPKILRAFTDAGSQYAFVEQDLCYGRDPFDCLKESFEYLHTEGYC